MEETADQPRFNGSHLQKRVTLRTIIFFIGTIIFLTIVSFELGMRFEQEKVKTYPTITPTNTNPTITPFPTPTSFPHSPTNNSECKTNADCPARNGCFIYQCISNKCRRINMCTNESPNYPQ